MKQKMYIGPTIPGVVVKNRIFKDKLPKKVQELAEKDVSFSRLLVPMDDLIVARAELKDKNSVLAVSYEKVKKYQ